MNRALKKSILLVAFWIAGWTPAARAEMVFGIYGGYSLGTLKRTTEEKFTTVSTLGTLGYHFRGFNLHGFFQSMDLAYKVGDSVYDGVYGVSGVGLGYQRMISKKMELAFAAQGVMSGNYIILSDSSSTVNGTSYKHSELTTLQGGSGMQLLGGVKFLIFGSGGSKKTGENFYTGVQLGYLQQTFATQTTRFKSNNSVIAPLSTGDESVNYSVSLMSLYLSINYDI